tara:strand:+ start:535 stop:675 length:141 start_codon:yes stop_codon:yes gene_type:complete
MLNTDLCPFEDDALDALIQDALFDREEVNAEMDDASAILNLIADNL